MWSLILFSLYTCDRSNHQRCSIGKGVLINFAKFIGKHLYQSFFFKKAADLRPAILLKWRLAQLLSCEFCEIPKNTVFTDHLWAEAICEKNVR